MADESGEKTEQPTQKHLQEAWDKGQFARSAEVQTAVVLIAGLSAMSFSGQHLWQILSDSLREIGQVHKISLSLNSIQGQFMRGALALILAVGPIVLSVMVAGLLMGGIQARFRTSPEALGFHWERLNPMTGFQRIFSLKNGVPTLVNLTKLIIIIALSYSVIKGILTDPIFYQTVDVARIAGFMADSTMKISVRVILALVAVAGSDYGYQAWKTHKEMMMSREDLKEEAKSSEGNPQMKSKMRKRASANSKRKMLMEVPKADVIVINPTHIAVALRYDRKTMKAPKIVAKGTRLNALKIREIAAQHQVPILENKALARMMFKYGKVGGEVPAQLYAAVAEVLAWVYRVNAYRYYREQSQ